MKSSTLPVARGHVGLPLIDGESRVERQKLSAGNERDGATMSGRHDSDDGKRRSIQLRGGGSVLGDDQAQYMRLASGEIRLEAHGLGFLTVR